MTCNKVRQHLLASEKPDVLAREDAAHLARCADCRKWLRRLVRIEQMLPLVPTPPSSPPPALLKMLEAAPDRPLVTRPTVLSLSAKPRREGARQKLALALSLAAALALFSFGWWALPHLDKPMPQQRLTVASIIEEELDKAHTRSERVHRLANAADRILEKAKPLPDNPAEVANLAEDFQNLVEHYLEREASRVSLGERAVVFPRVAARFRSARFEAEQLARKWQHRQPASAASMRQIAAAADGAERRLRQLAGV